MLSEEERFTPTVLDSETLAAIVVFKDSDYDSHIESINQFGEELQKRIKEIFDLPVSIGVSSPYSRLIDSKQALEQGIDSLKYRLKVGKEAIIFYENVSEIYASQQIQTYFPRTLENQLFEYIKLGETEKAKEALHLLLADLFKNSSNPHELEVNMMRFLNDLLNLMQVLGIDTLVISDYKNIYHAISEMKTSEEIELFVKNKIVYPMTDSIAERTESQFKSISDKMLHIIHTEFDSELSLEIIAARLHYNKNYLSSIFKKEFKQSFSEYLALYRFDVAKKWLRETSLSVREISERLQYNNSQNFIRSFRKMEGTTPGKYRDTHRNDYMSC
jgi:YesN/AraC family two-component response regulator